MSLTLSQGDLTLELDPHAGGAVQAFRHRDLDILRPGPKRNGPRFDARQYAAFPMVPFIGRIHRGQFHTDGRNVQLPANMPPEPHAIHGHGWQNAWTVDTNSRDHARLIYRYTGSDWPWSYHAAQSFTLSSNDLIIDLSVSNHAERPMPSGIGWHPYFLRDGAHLQMQTTEIWTMDGTTGAIAARRVGADTDLSCGRAVSDLSIDAAFTVANDPILITWPTHRVTLTSDPVFRQAVLYVPDGEDYFCAEPISHAPNAINSDLASEQTGLRWLPPGETLSGRITLSIER
ncbi:MAG: aldose 1-epimerase [Pseudomonadota bacterium]